MSEAVKDAQEKVASTVPPTPESGVRFTMLQVLIWATVVNFVLIFGGTIYSTMMVQSIQKTYQEAEARINDAKAKYQEASTDLAKHKAQADQASADVESLRKSFDRFDAQLSELNKESQRKLGAIGDEARAQLTQLKAERVAIGSGLRALEEDMKRTIAQNSSAIREEVKKHLDDAGKVVEETGGRLSKLAPAISELSIRIETKNQEIQGLQLTANRTLEGVRETDKALKEELAKLTQSQTVDAEMLWTHSNSILRSVYVAVALFILLRVILSIVALVRAKR